MNTPSEKEILLSMDLEETSKIDEVINWLNEAIFIIVNLPKHTLILWNHWET